MYWHVLYVLVWCAVVNRSLRFAVDVPNLPQFFDGSAVCTGSLAPVIWGDGLHFDGCEPEQANRRCW